MAGGDKEEDQEARQRNTLEFPRKIQGGEMENVVSRIKDVEVEEQGAEGHQRVEGEALLETMLGRKKWVTRWRRCRRSRTLAARGDVRSGANTPTTTNLDDRVQWDDEGRGLASWRATISLEVIARWPLSGFLRRDESIQAKTALCSYVA